MEEFIEYRQNPSRIFLYKVLIFSKLQTYDSIPGGSFLKTL